MKKLSILILCMLAALTSCKNDENGYVEEKLDFKHPQENLVGTFDYKVLLESQHPRLFIDAAGWEKIKAARSTDEHVEEACYIVTSRADSFLGAAEIVYEKDGKRLLQVSRNALIRISHCAAAYRLTGDEKYVRRAAADLTAVCSFADWNPSHFLDVGEMSAAVAIGYDWLYDVLPEETKALCRRAISVNGFYASDCGRGQYIAKINNWNQVCNGGISVAAMAFFEDQPTRYKRYIEDAVESVKLPMAEYGPDGNYAEGYGYWDYGTSFNVLMLSALDKIFGDDAGLASIDGFEKTGEYMLFMAGPAGAFNYSDGGSYLIQLAAQWYLAEKFDKPYLLVREKQLLERRDGYGYRHNSGSSRLFPMLVLPYVADAELDGLANPSRKLYYGRGLNPIVIARTTWSGGADEKYLGIKGGRAQENHGHMDVGSFVYDANGVRWAGDPGSENYTTVEQYVSDFWTMKQSSGRWSKVMRMQPELHNTLTVKGKLHQVSEYVDFDEIYETDTELGGSLDIASVLGNGVEEASRSVKIIDNEYLEVRDRVTVSGALTIRWNLFSMAKATVLSDDCIQLVYGNKSAYLHIESDKPVKLFSEVWTNKNVWDTVGGNTHVGFDCDLKAGETVNFRVTITDTQQ